MKIFALSIGGRDRASSRLRIWDHVDWLRDQGCSVAADSLVATGVRRATAGFFLRLLVRLPHWMMQFFLADVVVVQETLVLWMLMPFKNLGKQRRILFDFSDPIDRIGLGRKRRVRAWMLQWILAAADEITVENRRYLQSIASPSARLGQFYGPVDAKRYIPRSDISADGPIRIGWTGSPSTLAYIWPLFPVIDQIARDRPIELMLIGAGSVDYPFNDATLTVREWSESAEFALVPTFDLGLFRLDNSEEAVWRGAGKIFIYMAAGVPFIASDKGIAHDVLQESSAGFAVPDDSCWPDMLRRAVDAADTRRAMRSNGRTFAANSLSYEVYRVELARRLGLKQLEESAA